MGAVADHAEATIATTTQDVSGGVTVGTISLTNDSTDYWTITPTLAIILDQDDAGPGFATISNASSGGDMSFGTGALTLADNLLISNTGGSTYSGGAIAITSTITGTGNITIYNAGSNNPLAGQVRFGTGANKFVGSVLIQKGATACGLASSFGGVGNLVTLGQSGQGDATLTLSTSLTLPNNIVVAANSGTLTLGSTSTSKNAQGYSGTVTLNGSVTMTSATTTATNGLNFTGAISGVGGVNKIGAGILSFASTTANTYQGGTTITAGTMIAGNNGVLGTGDVALSASTTLTLNAAVTNAISDTATLTLGGSSTTSAKLNLLGAVNTSQETVGNLVLNGVTEPAGTYGNTGSGATNISTDYFSGTGILTVVGVTAVPEPSTCAAFAVALLGLVGVLATRRRIIATELPR